MATTDSLSVTMRVLQSVSAQTGVETLELPPLYDSVDPEALDAIVDDLDEGVIQFQYAGQKVIVQNDGTVSISEIADCSPE
ncbi:hypothetical protein G9C85_02615 [Halorubellus sp. JP-L1]|uniref:HalOD1 output domain-containing protein n=1 Tax=Halorubellus sp. JP-L1 TaxID=2715753 RepID=UPI00140E0597|nr:HalOD1 output domain-containing protein [Halorubellus sp. JP-L1]NHN40531.1 hypothetical protein [Halorubellus sp. JP-L1]